MKIKRKYWQKVLNGDLPSRLQMALSEPIASDLISVDTEELAKVHKGMHELLNEQYSSIWSEGWDYDLRPESNIVSLKLEILERWFSHKGLNINSGWGVSFFEKPTRHILMYESENRNKGNPENEITDFYDKGAAWMDVQVNDIEKFPSLLMILKKLEINIPIRAVCNLNWDLIAISLMTWLFDEVVIHGEFCNNQKDNFDWPGSREAEMLSLAGENVNLVISLTGRQDSEWKRTLDAWSFKNGVNLIIRK
ncbi:hypothetical protein CL659_02670 [bacterium]|nr:hypothetical protein [bacterium]|tara:strand:+ start:18323 stop:19075 length:753 start_codon:yes stop_codon:yes gene_type:complete